MKKIFLITLILLLPGCVQVATGQDAFFPEPTGYVVDSANILTDETKNELTKMLKNNETEIGVCIVETTYPYTIEEYGIKLAEKWKVGDKDKDDGIIFILATKDRKVRIEIGYGMEGKLNDSKAGKILDNDVVPSLKKDDWNNGVLLGIKSIINNVNL